MLDPKILRPSPHVLAFYDGRVAGRRQFDGENWVDDGALALGIASYAIVAGAEAIVYDTHTSLEHARWVRRSLEELGVCRITVVLSHWHLDHVAGNEVFSDCEIIANVRTARHLEMRRVAIEQGREEGPPAISPLILPNRTFDGVMTLTLGGIEVRLIATDIHSDDATVLWLPATRMLLAGDTMEDTVTYVVEPEGLATHIARLDDLWALEPSRILPNHGAPDVIAAGGYGRGLVRAQQQYIRSLIRARREPELRALSLRAFIAGPLEAGFVHYFAPYEDIHRANLVRVLESA